MNDKQRAEFEKWLQDGYNKDWLTSCSGYADPTVDRMWMAWQAAIASMKSLYVATYEQSEPIILNKEFVKD